MATPPDNRSPISAAMVWASQITTISLEMVAPIALGWYIDQHLETTPVFVAAGAALGLFVGMRSLIAITHSSRRNGKTSQGNGEPPPRKTP